MICLIVCAFTKYAKRIRKKHICRALCVKCNLATSDASSFSSIADNSFANTSVVNFLFVFVVLLFLLFAYPTALCWAALMRIIKCWFCRRSDDLREFLQGIECCRRYISKLVVVEFLRFNFAKLLLYQFFPFQLLFYIQWLVRQIAKNSQNEADSMMFEIDTERYRR